MPGLDGDLGAVTNLIFGLSWIFSQLDFSLFVHEWLVMFAAEETSVQYQSNLHRLTRLIAAALALFGALLIVIVAATGWSANSQAVQRERQQVENSLDDSVSRVLDEQKSIAWWDDALIYAGGPSVDTEWTDIQVGAFLNETYGHDEIFILNAANEPIYAYVDGARVEPVEAFARRSARVATVIAETRGQSEGALRKRALDFEAGQGNYRELLGAQHAAWSGHILNVEGAAAVVSAITIVPNVDVSLVPEVPNILVSVVHVDDAYMSDIGASLLLPDLALRADRSTDGRLAAQDFAADDGAPLGYLVWTTKRPGQSLLVFILPLVIAGVAGVGAMTAHMLSRLKRATTELATREERARYEAQHDALSGLPNRHHFADVLQQNLDKSAEHGAGAVVAYIDVDRFKDINDTLGHHAGDELIKVLSRRLSSFMSPNDFLARFGGDEFAIIRAPATLDAGDALADALRLAFAEPFLIFGQHIRMTASIGLAMAPDHGRTTEALMRHADIALYEAKKAGRDRSMFFSANMAWDVERRRGIELALREAIETDQLRLHYQPLISSSTGKITGVEALLRWRHPTRGDISPGLFVPIAEEAGLMPALGAWVLDRALADSKRWPGLQVAINLSPVQMRHVDLRPLLVDLLRKHDADPRQIVLELTEGVLLESTERTRRLLDDLREMGFKTALDDFGTGFSSLSYLCDFKFDKIKIDRAFVQGVSAGKQNMSVIQAVVSIGRGFGMEIVAEGVETETEASVLRLAGCHELQGFFFARPAPAEAISGLIAAFDSESDRRDGEASPAQVRRRFLRPITREGA